MTAVAIRRPHGLKVTYRRMQFPFERGFDRYWHGGSAFRSLFWSQMSAAFEPGEQFFIDSARALKGQVQDPALLEEIAEFCRQEGHHTAQHLKFDRMNAAHGIDIDGCRRRYAFVLDRARKRLDPMEMLAATTALEHFTAGFAHMFFENPRCSAGADPNVVALWAWHAAEEAEHKATCFDIYKQLGGGYFERVTTMIGSWFLILAVALLNTTILLKKDGKLFTLDTLRGLGYLFGRNGLVTGLLPSFFAYFRPRFHPWQENNAHRIREWEAGNQQYVVQRKPA
jgi:predicted metal-dependent hydrolase